MQVKHNGLKSLFSMRNMSHSQSKTKELAIPVIRNAILIAEMLARAIMSTKGD